MGVPGTVYLVQKSTNSINCPPNCNTVISGTSNGIGWTITSTNYWSMRTVTNGTFNFAALPVPAAACLFGFAMVALVLIRRKRS